MAVPDSSASAHSMAASAGISMDVAIREAVLHHTYTGYVVEIVDKKRRTSSGVS